MITTRFTSTQRDQTRRQRYDSKQNIKSFPISIATINFINDSNLGFVLRSAACFNAETVYCIGSIPSRAKLMPSSGSLVDYVNLIQFKNTHDFLEHAHKQNIKLISAELCEDAVSLFDYKFDLSCHCALIVGNEESGVPNELLYHSDKVFIPMNGKAWCMNTSQTATVLLAEYARQLNQSRLNNATL